MEIKYRLYPYPVLWDKNDDYKKPSKFLAEVEAKENFKNIKLKINFLLKDKEIEKLQHMMRHLETLEGEQTAKGTKKRRLSGKRKNKYVNRS